MCKKLHLYISHSKTHLIIILYIYIYIYYIIINPKPSLLVVGMNLNCFISSVINCGVQNYHEPSSVPANQNRDSLESMSSHRYNDQSGTLGGAPCMLDDAIPSTLFDPKSGGLNNNECPICIDAFESNHVVKTFPCRHVIHEKCAKAWFLSSAASDETRFKCPVCRQNWL